MHSGGSARVCRAAEAASRAAAQLLRNPALAPLLLLPATAYGGNRAPVPLYVHTGWLADSQEDVRRFVGAWRFS